MDSHSLAQFLTELSANNEKAWFSANRSRYDALRSEFVGLVGKLIPLLCLFDETLPDMDPAACLFRINRDVRFSNDKSPYKTTFSAAFPRGGSTGIEQPSYYFHIDARGQLLAAGGLYAPGSEQLAAIRASVAAHPEKLRTLIEEPAFQQTFGELAGESLRRTPRGYAADHPAQDLLRHKGFSGVHTTDALALKPEQLAPYIAQTLESAHPLVAYLRALAPVQLGS
jgi:uncharacterized protein (TIGR02453 family)